MTIGPGARIGPYEVTALLGEGGMGKVWRAHHIGLKRDDALKVLPEAFASDPERLARFQREAQILASLNHPNIAHVYGLEEGDGTKALVMEMVEGPTLADRIAKGPIPLDEVLPIALQIAEALEAAHEQGIIHRDLKSGNVKIRSDGTVKVLDFGLAKISHGGTIRTGSDPQDNAYGLTLSPTITSPAVMTQAGVILGTAAYMAPEQAKGKSVDKRADIWAFGVVLYEMVMGHRPFQGNDVGDVLASVIKEEPKWDDVPTHVRRLLQRCLEKDPKNRLRDISGVELLLETEVDANLSAGRAKPTLHWAIEAALVVGLAAALWRLWPSKPVDRPLVRLDVNLGSSVSLGSSTRGNEVVISPDGSRLAFISQNRLFTRRLDQAESIELAAGNLQAPFFSPDGLWIGFFSGGLKKVSVTGGPAILLADGLGFGGSWGEDGSIIASLDGRVLSRVPATGGTSTQLTNLADDEFAHRWPQILPGGKAILFTVRRPSGDEIQVMSLKDRRMKVLQKGGMYGRYLSRGDGVGHLLFLGGGTLFAMPFDLDNLEARGTPAPVLEAIAFNSSLASGAAQFDVAANGTLVYRSSGASGGLVTLQWVDASQKTEPLSAKPDSYLHPRVSPDGRRIALSIASPVGQDIWVYDPSRDSMLRLTFGGGAYQFPVWTPDGRYIVFTDGVGGTGMYWTRSDGASRPQSLTQNKNGQFPWSFSPDGKRLAFAEFPKGSGDIWTVPIESGESGLKAGSPEVFVQTPAYELFPAFSPDGRWIAYRSLESGTTEIYVRAFPDNGGKWLISTGGGAVPVWSPNGRELFYRTEDQRIMVVPYTQSNGVFVPDKPRQWSQIRLAEGNQRNLDITPDGKRFVALMPVATPEAQMLRNHVVFLQNFEDELRRRLEGRN